MSTAAAVSGYKAPPTYVRPNPLTGGGSEDILPVIFQYCDGRQVQTNLVLCRAWRRIQANEITYAELVKEQFKYYTCHPSLPKSIQYQRLCRVAENISLGLYLKKDTKKPDHVAPSPVICSSHRLINAKGVALIAIIDRHTIGILRTRFNDVKMVGSLNLANSAISCSALLPQNRVAVGVEDTVQIWDYAAKKRLHQLKIGRGQVTAISVLDNGDLGVGTKQGIVKILDFKDPKKMQVIEGFKGEVTTLMPCYTGCLVSGGTKGEIQFWDMRSGKMLKHFKGSDAKVHCLALMPRCLLSAGEDGAIQMWNVKQGKVFYTLKGHTQPITCMQFLPDGRLLSGSLDRTVRIWKINANEAVCQSALSVDTPINSLCFEPNGRLIVGSNEGKFTVINFSQEIPALLTHMVTVVENTQQLSQRFFGNFACLSEPVKRGVYKELLRLTHPNVKEVDHGEYVFAHRYGYTSTPAQKKAAILAYCKALSIVAKK